MIVEETILDKLRGQIDNTDNEILILLKRRFQTVKKIADYKLRNDLDTHQPDREQEIINKIVGKSMTMEINSRFITRVYDEIFTESKKLQEEFLSKKKQN